MAFTSTNSDTNFMIDYLDMVSATKLSIPN